MRAAAIVVAFAAIVAWYNRASPIPPIDAPLAIVGEKFATIGLIAAPIIFAGLIWLLYSRTKAMVR